MAHDPLDLLETQPMRRRQIAVVALCIALNALDGFDVLAISFAAPGIAAEWGIDRAVLGIVLSMELFGMAAGSVILGGVADRIGRRPTIIGCLAVMTAGMFLAAQAHDVTTLSLTRLLTGLGIGGMLSSTSAIVAEYSNARRRGLAMSLNIAGYSTGAILGGLVVTALLERTGDWRAVFLFGGAVSAIALPLTFLLLPESIASLLARRPAGALEQVNRTLQWLRLPVLSALPSARPTEPKASFTALFSPAFGRATILLTITYFAQIMAFYYIQKWIPKVVVDMGFDAASAGRVLVAANVGCLLGALAIGFVSLRFPLRRAIIAAMLIAFALVASIGLVPADRLWLSLLVGLAGFFTNAAVVGLYPIFARTFPASLRAGGTGFVIGVGRGGSAIGPVLAGALFAAGGGLFLVSAAMGAGALVAAGALYLLGRNDPAIAAADRQAT